MDDPIEFHDFDRDESEDEVRYGLTALGALHLEDRRFSGFGPCSAMRPSVAASASSPARRRVERVRARRATPLFG